MSRHSKNSTALGFFTYAEKQRLNYGTQKQRLGRDSMRNFDACFLCLQTARDPLSCTEGHIACKECIYENIVAQKKEIARQNKDLESRKSQLEEERKRKEAEAQDVVIREFEKTQSQISASRLASKTAGEEQSRVFGLKAEDIEARSKVVRDEALTRIEKQEQEKNKSALPSFWIPTLTPDSKSDTLEPAKQQVMCTAAKPHPTNIKKLTPVVFTKSNEPDSKNPAGHMCPSCLKTLNNGMKISISKSCGHVLCKHCMDKFVKSTQKCFVCDKKCRPKDIVQLHSEGTGYAGGGGNVEVKKWDVAFQ
ncbi:hypothetical protein K493DRAFT_379862 [Basidiobolus meristosporus CBS 931.73]|uniref:RING-type domain-containing protein n=1 Tax=Basidiobolus meristosporus CBS 931.73 TaxID=1314790 RepID=A0A1Y1XYT0_9FUNG|nr:hypothetical protein K493DRAFT_379862 [Basidiobolus meristosporus CBS 931.73]|eukprot:ORX90901.1 hypothetical protein K493DRAFT_379862 [Basidiobolus meristosporus CBS 931.73]